MSQKIPLLVISNEPTVLKGETLKMLYRSLSVGQLAYMDAKIEATGEIVPMLVGLDPIGDNEVQIFPIAKLLMDADDPNVYLVPDGNGNYNRSEDAQFTVPDEVRELLGDDSDDGEEEAGPTERVDKKQTLH